MIASGAWIFRLGLNDGLIAARHDSSCRNSSKKSGSPPRPLSWGKDSRGDAEIAEAGIAFSAPSASSREGLLRAKLSDFDFKKLTSAQRRADEPARRARWRRLLSREKHRIARPVVDDRAVGRKRGRGICGRLQGEAGDRAGG